ncbi:MAG: hypothetical protein LUH08_00925 [Ruminococcus sp.]|nr:hypothetical protein [Ruminococcus sp.]
MFKKLFAVVLSLVVVSSVFCACGDDNKATISKDDTSTDSTTQTTEAVESSLIQSGVTEISDLTGEKSKINSYMDIINGGTYTLSGTLTTHSMGLVSESPVKISSLDNDDFYYNVTTVAASSEYLVTDSVAYVLNVNDQTYALCESKTVDSIKAGVNTYLPSLKTLTYLDTYEVEYNDESYVRERYEVKNNVGEEQTVSYFFDGDELKIIRFDSNVLETIIQSDFTVLEFENEADESVFEIPDGYTEITETELEQNKNNTPSSDEYILALFESLGVTDEDLESMGYTKEEVLAMDEQERSVFLAELFGESFE